MIVSDQDEVEKWLGRVCRQIDFPGVRLEYAPLQSGGETSTVRRIDPAGMEPRRSHLSAGRFDQSSVAWQTPIHASENQLGHLQIRLTSGQTLQKHFIRACDFAEQISRLAVDYAGLLVNLQASAPYAKLSSAAIQQGGLQPVIEQSLKSVVRLTGYRGVAFFLLDATGRSLHLKQYLHQALEPLSSSQRQLSEADHDRAALLDGTAVYQRQSLGPSNWLPADVRTGVCVRVANEAGIVGTLWVYDRRVRSTDDRDLHVVESIAAQLGTLLDHAISSLNSANHRRMKTELRIASATQPAQTIQYDDTAGRLSAFGKCLSQYDVGGDLCEVIRLDQEHVFVVVGDASGNSIPAAMVMTAVRGAIYALLAEIREHATTQTQVHHYISQPALFMRQINRMLCKMTAAHQFMSCICGTFNLSRRDFTFCNAGHPSPIHLADDNPNYLASHGLLLGIDDGVEYEQETISYCPDDVIVFYTDGISEALSQTNRLFRQDGIAAAALLHAHENPVEIVDSIWNRMLAHQAGSGESDDATILAVKLA